MKGILAELFALPAPEQAGVDRMLPKGGRARYAKDASGHEHAADGKFGSGGAKTSTYEDAKGRYRTAKAAHAASPSQETADALEVARKEMTTAASKHQGGAPAKTLKVADKKPFSPSTNFHHDVADIVRDLHASGTDTSKGARGAKFGSKVFIGHVWDKFREKNPQATREEFNEALLDANRKGDLKLSRADLVGALNKHDMQDSEIKTDAQDFHFIRADELPERYAKKSEAKWITMNGSHVQVDGKGAIKAGPADLAKKGVTKLDDLGKKQPKDKPRKKDPEPRTFDEPKDTPEPKVFDDEKPNGPYRPNDNMRLLPRAQRAMVEGMWEDVKAADPSVTREEFERELFTPKGELAGPGSQVTLTPPKEEPKADSRKPEQKPAPAKPDRKPAPTKKPKTKKPTGSVSSGDVADVLNPESRAGGGLWGDELKSAAGSLASLKPKKTAKPKKKPAADDASWPFLPRDKGPDAVHTMTDDDFEQEPAQAAEAPIHEMTDFEDDPEVAQAVSPAAATQAQPAKPVSGGTSPNRDTRTAADLDAELEQIGQQASAAKRARTEAKGPIHKRIMTAWSNLLASWMKKPGSIEYDDTPMGRWQQRIAASMPLETYARERYERQAFAEFTRNVAKYEANWDEAKHPRADNGEFGAGGSEESTVEKTPARQPTKWGEAKRSGPDLVMADGSKSPAHIKPGMIPPAWTSLRVSLDPEADVLATGRDAKGNAKTLYADTFHARNAAVKFARIREMLQKHDAIGEQILKDVGSSDPKVSEAAIATWLMYEQGTRPGSESDVKGVSQHFGQKLTAKNIIVEEDQPTKSGKPTQSQVFLKVGKEKIPIRDKRAASELVRRKESGGELHDSTYWLKSHGATTLEARHVVPDGKGGARIQFMGKESVWHDHQIRNPKLAKALLAKAKGKKGKLFETNETKVGEYMGKLGGGGFTPKDLRTARANKIAIAELQNVKPPNDENERKATIKAIAEKVSGVLGNRPAQALESYIDPNVFSVLTLQGP